ncbi:MAG: hypothetical protein AAF730_05280 [Bacteroidota bacterium]
MTPHRWSRLRSLFNELADSTDHVRTTRIAEEHLDAILHDELRALLRAHDTAAPILDDEPPGHRLNGGAPHKR